MRHNYPAAKKGGVSQQEYEAKTGIQRSSVKLLLKAARIEIKELNIVVDLGCRNADTTLGILEYAAEHGNNAVRVIGVEEYSTALRIAKLKFGIDTIDNERFLRSRGFLADLPNGWIERFQEDARRFSGRVEFVHSRLAKFYENRIRKSDLVVGYQTLHWMNRDRANFLPKMDILASIYLNLARGGVFLAGTSTAFVDLDPDAKVEGKTRANFSIDEHPFVKMVFDQIKHRVEGITSAEPKNPKPTISMEALKSRLEILGFNCVELDGFLVTPSRQAVIDQVVKVRPAHQGLFEDVPGNEVERILIDSIAAAHRQADLSVPDPRLDDKHIYDVVPFIVASKV